MYFRSRFTALPSAPYREPEVINNHEANQGGDELVKIASLPNAELSIGIVLQILHRLFLPISFSARTGQRLSLRSDGLS
jgi:hypothetical protein